MTKLPSLSRMFLALKSILSDYKIAAFFWLLLVFHSFTFKWLDLYIWSSLLVDINISFLLSFLPENLHLFIDIFRLFTFNVIISKFRIKSITCYLFFYCLLFVSFFLFSAFFGLTIFYDSSFLFWLAYVSVCFRVYSIHL